MAYSFDYTRRRNETVDWILDGSFKKSPLKFKAPGIMNWRVFELYMLKEKFMVMYFEMLGNYINRYMAYYLPFGVLKTFPISYIFDYDR